MDTIRSESHQRKGRGNAFEWTACLERYLADLTGDGLPELCAAVSIGSGIVDERIIVCDYAASKTYELQDRSYYDYLLYLDSGRLMAKQSSNADTERETLATGQLAILDGELTAIGIDRTIPNP